MAKDQKRIKIRPGNRERKLAPRNVDAVEPGDAVEYALTIHFPPHLKGEPEAWIRYGITSYVREGESADEADRRVREHVEAEANKRARDLAEDLAD